KIGFQYVDFEIEGDDIIYLCRTAMNNAHNYHDANYSTFHRIKNFRDLIY
ncbi:MAG: exo-alpha-sialidase, partial [Ruminococcaceae bacterium]|nr:exo-alpha-sialidase [Oscillospiraceae bacterium]